MQRTVEQFLLELDFRGKGIVWGNFRSPVMYRQTVPGIWDAKVAIIQVPLRKP